MKKLDDLKVKWKLWVQRDSEGNIIYIADWAYKGQAPRAHWQRANIPWEELTPFSFEATVRPDGYGKGRSAINFYFIDVDSERRYPVSASGTSALLKAITQGVVGVDTETGTFTALFKWAKKGTAYSVEPIIPSGFG